MESVACDMGGQRGNDMRDVPGRALGNPLLRQQQCRDPLAYSFRFASIFAEFHRVGLCQRSRGEGM